MIAQKVNISDNFRRRARLAILSIALFIIVFFAMISAAIWLLINCFSWALGLVMVHPSLITILLGIGLASVGLLVLFFLLKFLFARNKVDRSNLHQIQRSEEPQLFALIDEVVQEVGTTAPKSVYLSANVNASVFYDSSFWSMFLPIRKNLQIGLGLVNGLTVAEFKAVVAHEFGHFSQRSMKVGSYVYNVNHIIHNMLYDNDGFGRLVANWASVSAEIAIFVQIAIKIVQGIQWILGKVYQVVNVSYMGLSREMEFQADEIAAHLTGSAPLQTALLRLDLMDQAYNSTLNFFGQRISEGVKTNNLYLAQDHVLQTLAKANNLDFANGLPQVSLEDYSRFYKTKLVIENQWASHPSTEDRITALAQLGIATSSQEQAPAGSLFVDFTKRQQMLTNKVFEQVKYKDTPTALPIQEFNLLFDAEFNQESMPLAYNGYYDQRLPKYEQLSVQQLDHTPLFEDLFNDEKVEMVNDYLTLNRDQATVEQIVSGNTAIKTFDYDGKKYRASEAKALSEQLQAESAKVLQAIAQHDQLIYNAFIKSANYEQAATLQSMYLNYKDYHDSIPQRLDIQQHISARLIFTQEQTPNDIIIQNFRSLEVAEETLKEKIRELLQHPTLGPGTPNDFKRQLEHYLSEQWRYFGRQMYFEENLNVLYGALSAYEQAVYFGLRTYMRKILDFQLSLGGRLASS